MRMKTNGKRDRRKQVSYLVMMAKLLIVVIEML